MVLLALVGGGVLGGGVLGVGTGGGVAGDLAAEARVEGAEPGDLRLERLPLYFVENRGQADERVSYYLQGRETAVYFTPHGVTYSLTGPQPDSTTRAESGSGPEAAGLDEAVSPADGRRAFDARAGGLEGSASPVEARVRAVSYGGDDARLAQPVSRWAVKLDFVEANTDVRMEGVGRTPAVVSYFKGTSFEGRTGLPTYSQVAYRDLWPGIDLVYSGTVDRLKYQFVVRPGADPDQIRLAYRGAAVEVNAEGQLEVSTPVAGFRDDKPWVYQHGGGETIEIAASYRLEPRVEQGTVEQRAKRGAAAYRPASTASASPEGGYTFGFELGAYDPSRVLIIDPSVLVYAGYIGGTALDRGADVAVDSAGNAYVTGETMSAAASFPVAAGPDLTFNGDTDAFVVKVNAAGTALVYAGYLGGSEADRGASIAVDAAGAAYLTGETESDATTFPTLIGPDLTFNGGTRDAFVAKIDPSGTALLYAGYIGGDEADAGQGIAVDAAGNAYVTGGTLSEAATFPLAVGPDLTFNGGQDGFVAKGNAAGTALLYAGYLGGSADDRGFDIAVWGEGEVFVTGETSSAEDSFPVTVGPDLTYNGGLSDAFVVKVRADGTVLDYAGYVGGEATDIGHGIAVDADGKATIAGETGSDETTFPVVRGPDLTYNGGLSDAFAAQVAPDGTALIYAGYIGGDSLDRGHGIALDGAGNAFITGNTLIYAGYFGGAGVDIGNGVAVDSEGSVYVAGPDVQRRTGRVRVEDRDHGPDSDG